MSSETDIIIGILIDAIAQIQHKIPALSVNIFGDGPHMQLFREQVTQYGLTHKIKFSGKLNGSQVHEVLSAADVFCFPTYSSEGFPKVVIEAMAHGIPVISTPVSVIPHLVNDAQKPAGLLVEKRNVDDLVSKILFYYENPMVHKMHADNAKSIASVYTLEKWVDAIDEILNVQWNTKICRLRSIVK